MKLEQLTHLIKKAVDEFSIEGLIHGAFQVDFN